MNGLKREKHLFEEAPMAEAILSLAMPAVMGQIILVIYNMADTFFVGLTGSDAMITAVTVCMPAFMFLSAIANLFGVGGASVIARALGNKNVDRARDTASFAFWGCLIAAAVYCIGVVRIGDEVLLRHIQRFGKQLALTPSNPAYNTMIVSEGDVQIIGKVIETRLRF